MNDFIREKICFYSSVLKGQNSSFGIVRSAIEHGVAGVELMNFSDELKTPDMKVAKEIGALAKSNGLALPCFSCGVNFAKDTADNLERIKRYADICSELEIPYLHHTLILSFDRSIIGDRLPELMDIAVECALEINDYAAKKGVQTVVEDQGFVVNGVTRYGEFMKRTDGKIGVLLDFGNIMFVDEKPEDFYAAFPDVKQIHIKDYTLTDAPVNEKSYKTSKGDYLTDVFFGNGVIAMDKLASALKTNGYDGYYSLEGQPLNTDSEVDVLLEKIAKVFG